MSELELALRAAGVDILTLAPLTEDGAYGIYTLTVAGAEAIALWRRLRELFPQTGHWPVLLGEEQDLEMHREELEDTDDRTPTEVIQQGLERSPQDWLAKQEKEWDEDGEFSLNDYRGEWPNGDSASNTFYTLGNGKSQLYLGLIPASQGWEVPALLRMGGWNECPMPEVHVSLMRYWHDRYGAELVVATHDIVEMQVARPPATREEALALATEQFFYCEDIVSQGTETLERLASALLNGTVWYFWWD